jgi:hypothetical protein
MKRPPNNFLPNQKIGELMANFSFEVILSDVGKKDKLLKFSKLVQDGKFPLNNIAFELFLDIVEWFDKNESLQMRNSPSTLQFFVSKYLYPFKRVSTHIRR